MHRHLLWALSLALMIPSCTSGTLPEGPFPVDIENGTRRTTTGDDLRYDLFIPIAREDLPPPPWPAVILTHGFARDRTFQRNNALYLAQRGIVVLTPDMVSLLPGESAQLRNIANTTDHVEWLRQRAADPQDRLAGLVDPQRIGLAGHSAGGAVSFEAAIELQQQGRQAAAVVLLDAVPWDRTLEQASDLAAMPLVSLRSEPANCNANGRVLELLRALTFPAADVRIVGATHCDPENPTDMLCTLVCGGGSRDAQQTYQRLLYLFFQDAFAIPSAELQPETWQQALAAMVADGIVVEGPIDPP